MSEPFAATSDELVHILGINPVMLAVANLPAPIVPVQEFRHELASALDESRCTLEPFSVLLLRIDDLSGSDQVMDEERRESYLRQIGLHIATTLRIKQLPTYPQRKLDVVSWCGHYFMALCANTDPARALVPANRVVTKLERIMPSLADESEMTIRMVFWTWDWRTCHQTELSVLKQLRTDMEARPSVGVEQLPAQRSRLESKLSSLLGSLNPG